MVKVGGKGEGRDADMAGDEMATRPESTFLSALREEIGGSSIVWFDQFIKLHRP